MQVQKVYDRKYNGRRIIVMSHSIGEDLPEEYKDDFMKWYCGYMEILAADKDYTTVNENENPADESCVEELYPNAIGGVTWVGYLPQEGIDNNNQYVGFDTSHYFPNEYQPTLKDVVRALHDMVDKDQVAINGGKQNEDPRL